MAEKYDPDPEPGTSETDPKPGTSETDPEPGTSQTDTGSTVDTEDYLHKLLQGVLEGTSIICLIQN